MKRNFLPAALSALALVLCTSGNAAEQASWALKPKQVPKYVPPHKPITRVADLRKKHAGQTGWHEVVVDDDYLHSEYIAAPAGSKTPRRFHPDTREWWIVIDGQIRFNIEGQEPFVATHNSMVQVPAQTVYSMETIGDAPSLRFEVNIPKAKTLYPDDVTPPAVPGFDWIKVKLNRKPFPYGRTNVPHLQLSEVVERPVYKDKNFLHRFVLDERGVANIIYGWEKKLPPLDVKDRGHYHPECAEFWLILAGQIRYPIEGQDVIIADVGDLVYVPPFTFHAPRFYGPGPSCRLAMNGYENIAHLRDAEPH